MKYIYSSVRTTFFTLLGFYAKQFRVNNKKFSEQPELRSVCLDDIPPAKINNVMMGKKIDLHPKTIYRHLKILEDAGIIQKVNHGTKNDYDVFISADLLLISDMQNPDFSVPAPWSEKPENGVFQGAYGANCTQFYLMHGPFINIISTVKRCPGNGDTAGATIKNEGTCGSSSESADRDELNNDFAMTTRQTETAKRATLPDQPPRVAARPPETERNAKSGDTGPSEKDPEQVKAWYAEKMAKEIVLMVISL
ncbi:MAG: winged helix-turn-helix domain-containing protein, partial [Bacteroidetes bacterium]|nr:winged helix-turn-helix domain-containing protein [Bacteroidota bacterium]